MVKIIEEIIAIKIHRMVKDSDASKEVLSEEQKALLMEGLPALAEQVLGDDALLVEIVELD